MSLVNNRPGVDGPTESLLVCIQTAIYISKFYSELYFILFDVPVYFKEKQVFKFLTSFSIEIERFQALKTCTCIVKLHLLFINLYKLLSMVN